MADSEKMEKKNAVVNVVGEENRVEEKEEEEEEKLMEEVPMLDFDMLCATVALQTQTGFSSRESWGKYDDGESGGGGVQRMWEGEVFDCCEDRRIALETVCCPCYRFGKNMQKVGFGPSFLQGAVYFVVAAIAILNYIAYAITEQRGYLYLAVVFTLLSGMYLGFFRGQIRKQFNIGGNDSSLDDCVNHLLRPCCTLCQESRTLEINNVQDGVWRGRGDTIAIGSYGKGSKGFIELRQPSLAPTKSPNPCSMQRPSVSSDHSWSVDINQSVPLVPSTQ